ncbi:MAG: hypothetical protein IJU42_00650 [Erysipelotrichaceae bacterium]|jgi:hypothetical protein|nr:hypothetical protein [Erysipelotrichaceae bacterium]
MSFESYIREMKRLGWSDEELQKDYDLHERSSDQELPWFPYEKKNGTVHEDGAV